MSWKVLHTGETDALAVKKRLKEKHVEALAPSRAVTRVRRGKKVRVERALIEGYVFARRAVGVRGVRDVLKDADGNVATVSDDELAKIGSPPPKASEKWKRGARVRVIDGLFCGTNGKIAELARGRRRAVVHLHLFGRPTPAEFDLQQLEVFDEGEGRWTR